VSICVHPWLNFPDENPFIHQGRFNPSYGPLKRDYFSHEAVDFTLVVHESVIVKAKPVRLFIKPYCGWCHKAIRWLDEHDIEYKTIDVIADETAFDEMIRLSGQELAPVLEVNGQVLADFGPEQLPAFWKQIQPQMDTDTHR
jgi:glutaredoxin 3